MRRTLVLFATLLLLWLVVVQLNHGLAPRHIYLWVGGLFVAHAALHEPLRGGLTASALAGMLWDATTPVAFGTHLLLFSAVHVLLFNLRDRLPREDTAAQVVIVLLVNLAAFLVFSFLQVSQVPAPAAVWPRIIFDLICSQVLIALVTPWFLALQERALHLAMPLAERFGSSFE
jgi:rod shape-determining protein MreD